jgi:hypothetical protein
LVAIVLCVADAVFVVAVLPDLTFSFMASGEGVTAFDELDGLFNGFRRSEKNVNVVWHDDESMELKFTCFTVAEEYIDHPFRVGSALKMGVPLVGDGGQGIGAGLETHGLGCS